MGKISARQVTKARVRYTTKSNIPHISVILQDAKLLSFLRFARGQALMECYARPKDLKL